jgi:RNA polymerase sigma-70 factor (ECF subfamily)
MYEPSEPPGEPTVDRFALDEDALAAGLRARTDPAVASFLEHYRSLILHCIGQFESDPTQREDLYQELMAYVLERLDAGSFDSRKGSFGTWLYRVAWCRCVDLKRRESASRRLPTVPSTEDVREPSDGSRGPAQEVGGSEVGELVRSCLEELDPGDADLLRMRHLAEMTLVDIAEARSQSLETVKYRVKRATQSLRQRLLARHVTPELVE